MRRNILYYTNTTVKLVYTGNRVSSCINYERTALRAYMRDRPAESDDHYQLPAESQADSMVHGVPFVPKLKSKCRLLSQ